jgi:hypothetical protein
MRVQSINSFLLLFAPALVVAQGSEPSSTPNPDAASVAAIAKAAMGAEVHAVGISRPANAGFGAESVKSWTQFVELLRQKEGPAERIWNTLPKKTQEFASNENLVGKLDIPSEVSGDVLRLKSAVGATVGGILAKPDLYDEKAFKNVPLDKNLKDMLALGKKRTLIQTLRMNRELLTAAFPNVVNPVPANYLIAPVYVKAGKPVILVLSSYRVCQWQVEVEKGGSVVGVIVCGHGPQEVAGIKAPLLYRSGLGPNGEDRWGQKEDVIWGAYDRAQELFPQHEAGVKKITGKTFTTFQGQSATPKEGFVVKPSAK